MSCSFRITWFERRGVLPFFKFVRTASQTNGEEEREQIRKPSTSSPELGKGKRAPPSLASGKKEKGRELRP